MQVAPRVTPLFDMPEIDAESAHQPVMVGEILQILEPSRGGVFIDCTLGAGGHSNAILDASKRATVIGIDRDPEALDVATARLKSFGERFRGAHANFADVAQVVESFGLTQVNGILADLGVSSMQLDSETRGFSFRFDAPLDMRMDPRLKKTAADLLAQLDEEELANIIYQFGEERFSRRVARRIVERRKSGDPVTTTRELAELAKRAVPHSRKDSIHPATRTFQALRIAVNGELEILDGFIADAVDLLTTDGILAIITFHSLEDRYVKHAFHRLSGRCQCPPRMPVCVCGAAKRVEIITKKPLVAGPDEQQQNPRSRSAKVRACRKIEQ